MQSEPSESSQKASSQEPTPNFPASSYNHGNQPNDHDGLRAGSSQEAATLGGYSGSTDLASVTKRDSSSERDAFRGNRKRMSPTITPPRNRISEYENALSKTPKNPISGPSFQVVRKERMSPNDSCAKLTDLPNGTLPSYCLDTLSCLQLMLIIRQRC